MKTILAIAALLALPLTAQAASRPLPTKPGASVTRSGTKINWVNKNSGPIEATVKVGNKTYLEGWNGQANKSAGIVKYYNGPSTGAL